MILNFISKLSIFKKTDDYFLFLNILILARKTYIYFRSIYFYWWIARIWNIIRVTHLLRRRCIFRYKKKKRKKKIKGKWKIFKFYPSHHNKHWRWSDFSYEKSHCCENGRKYLFFFFKPVKNCYKNIPASIIYVK